MSTPTACYRRATDCLATWKEEVLTGTPPLIYSVGRGALAQIEIGAGLIALVGGAPGAGKTALASQWTIDALRLNPTLHAIICNVEMSLSSLLDRQLARLSGVDLTTIRHRDLGVVHRDRIDRAMATLESVADRLCFVRPPFDLANIAASADEFQADLVVLDYLQRISPPGRHGGDRRASVDSTMTCLRGFADAGMAILAVAAVARSRDSRGRSSYQDGLGLASFRESSELEFGADDAFMLVKGNGRDTVLLQHLKSRHGEPKNVELRFDRRLQRFESITPGAPPRIDGSNAGSELATLWEQTSPAEEGETS